jgi:alanine dehydrogenase
VRHISAAQLDRLLTYSTLADAIRDAFADQTLFAPQRLHFQTGAGDTNEPLLIMPAWRPGGVSVIKLVTVRPTNADCGRPTVQGLLAVFEGESGAPVATIDATALTRWRTASASLLAARYLARKSSRVMAMIGAGAMARHLIQAYCSEFLLEEIVIWSRTYAHAQRLAAETVVPPGVRVIAKRELAEAIAVADIVSCATLAERGLVCGAWVKPGTHVDLVGAFTPTMRESDDDLIRRAAIYVDVRAGALAEAGDLVQPIASGVITARDIRGDLADLATGRRSGRVCDESVTLFKSVGHAIEDFAAGELVMAAKKNQAGDDVPRETSRLTARP